MKHFFLLLALGLTPCLVLAQPEQPPQPALNAPKFKINEENLSSLALVGSFYNTMQRAKTYSGHFVITKTKTTEGKITLQKVVDWKSTWTGDGNGHFKKRRADVLYTETIDGKQTKKSSVIVDDGETAHRFLATNNTWSKQPHEEDTDLSQAIIFMIWMSQLLGFDQGAEFKTEVRTIPGKPKQLVVSEGNGFEFVLNEQTGLLESWTLSSKDGEKTELRFLELELNKPVPDVTFAWKTPEGARQVAPEETEQKVEL